MWSLARAYMAALLLGVSVGPIVAQEAPPTGATEAPQVPTAAAIVKHIQAGEFEAGLVAVELALASSPTEARLWYLKGFILANLERPDEAAAAAGQALSIDPRFEGGNLLLARLQEEMGQFETALEHYGKELEIAKSATVRRDALLGLATGSIRLKRFPDAIAALEQIQKIAPGHMGAMEELADLYSRAGRAAEAQALLDRVAVLRSNDPTKLYELAVSRHGAGDLEAAAVYLRKTIELKEDYAEAHLLLGQTYVSLSLREKAAEQIRRYLELAPSPDAPAVADARRLLDELTKYDE